MKITDQPGRLFAIFLFGPYLIYTAHKISDHYLLLMGIIFILYEIFWVLSKCYKICYI